MKQRQGVRQSSLSRTQSDKTQTEIATMDTNQEQGEPIATELDRGFHILLADVTSYDWEAELLGAERPVCSDYATQLLQKSAQLAQSGDVRGERVFHFLGSVAFMDLRPTDNDSPFAPSIEIENRRS